MKKEYKTELEEGDHVIVISAKSCHGCDEYKNGENCPFISKGGIVRDPHYGDQEIWVVFPDEKAKDGGCSGFHREDLMFARSSATTLKVVRAKTIAEVIAEEVRKLK